MLGQYHSIEEDTWEREEEIRECYLHRFDECGTLLNLETKILYCGEDVSINNRPKNLIRTPNNYIN